jgi:hypothetical protein
MPMEKTPRIVFATATSIMLNIMLLVLSPSDPDGHPSIFWRAIDIVSAPSTFTANSLFSHGHSPMKELLQGIVCSIVYYTFVVWLAITLFSSFRTSMRRRGEVGKD